VSEGTVFRSRSYQLSSTAELCCLGRTDWGLDVPCDLRLVACSGAKKLGQMKSVQLISKRHLAVFVFSNCFLATAGAVADTALEAYPRNTPSSAVVATVNSVPVTLANVDVAVTASGKRDTVALRRAVKHQLIALELLRQAAAQNHYTIVKRPAQGATQADRTIEAIQLYLRDVVRPAPVSDADVMARYSEIVADRGGMIQRPRNRAMGAGPIENGMLLNQCCFSAVRGWDIAMQNETSEGGGRRIELGPTAGGEYKRDRSFQTRLQLRDSSKSDGLFTTRTGACNDHGFLDSDVVRFGENPRSEALLGKIRQQLEAERLNEAIRAVVDDLMARADISE